MKEKSKLPQVVNKSNPLTKWTLRTDSAKAENKIEYK
jgi:hypothetical protein